MKRQLIIGIAALALILPGVLMAQGDITFEGLAAQVEGLTSKVSDLFTTQDDLAQRLAAVETAIAPTPTPVATATPTSTPTPAATATPTSIPEPSTVLVVTVARGNARSGPGTQHAVVGAVSKDDVLTGPYQESGGWYQFCCVADGQTAWISATLVSVKAEGELTSWEEARNSAVEIDRKDLIRNNEAHIGKLVYFDNAYVVQAFDDGMIVNRQADGIGNTLILSYPHTPLRIIAGDTIDFVAEVIGVHTYESVSYGMITSPVLSVVELRIQE